MQTTSRFLLLLASCVVLLSISRHTLAFNANGRQDLSADPMLTVAVLEELIQNIQKELHDSSKRRFDGGYGSRYAAAQNVGSKLMALKQAADWNGPGRKRRDSEDVVGRL